MITNNENENEEIRSTEEILQEISDKLYKIENGNKLTSGDTIINKLSGIQNAINASTKGIFNDKTMFKRYLASLLYAFSDFEKNTPDKLSNKAIQNASVLANKIF